MSESVTLIIRMVFWISFSAVAYTYFIYPLLLMLLSCLKNRPALKSEINVWPTVTMVISAYNEQDVIAGKIRNCTQINYPPDKITFMIGSDGSDDRTPNILARLSDPRFHCLHLPQRRGKVQMLNTLMQSVSSDLVVFSDANTMYQPDAIQHLVSEFQNKKVGCVIGKLNLIAPQNDAQACQTESLYWRYENIIKKYESRLGIVPSINGGIFAIRRELYETLPAQAVTEDQVLGMKILTRGFRCTFADRALAFETVSNLAGELRRRIRISAGNFQSLFLVPEILNPFCGPVSFAFFSHKLLRWLVPFFLLTMLSANILLVGKLFYGSTLILQGLFYAAGILATCIPKLSAGLKILTIPKYFLAMNIAILIGFARFVTHRQHVTWTKATRF